MTDEIEEVIPGLVSARQAVSKYGLTYRRIWAAQATHRLRAVLNGKPDSSFREWMVMQGFGNPDETWMDEDVEAWFRDERA